MDSGNEQLSQEEESGLTSRRRFRTNFSDLQTAVLEKAFLASHYPDPQAKRGANYTTSLLKPFTLNLKKLLLDLALLPAE